MTITQIMSEERRIRLVLYTSPNAVLSARAMRNMAQILADYEETAVGFEVCDISRDPAAAAKDGISFTPTLVRRYPGPRAWVLGDLDEPSAVRRMLDGAGAPRKLSVEDLSTGPTISAGSSARSYGSTQPTRPFYF